MDVAGTPGVRPTTDGVKLAVAPGGRPVALRVTLPPNPPEEVRVMATDPPGVFERLSDTVDVFAVRVTLPPGVTVKLRLAVCASAPLVPVTVNG